LRGRGSWRCGGTVILGELGLGNLDSQWKPVVCPAFRDRTLKAIACGGAHTLFLTDNGCVYATGLNDFGQLGVSESKHYSVEPLCVFGEEKKVVQVSAGYNHSCAITVDGELYMWGKNTSVQLGLGKRAPNIVPLPTKVEYLNGINIKMAALGSDHSLAISDGGEAFSWGVGVSGRLGHGHESSILGFFKSYSEYTPRLIKDLEGIKRLKAMSDATKPSLIGELPSSKVVCGGYHTCVLTNQGPFLKSSVSQLSCGWKNTAAISEGRVFTWGWGGSNGTFSEGHGSDVDYINPTRVCFGEDVKALQVSCGFNHTGAILEYA
ncbi:Ultraviolet-B receptor UVR8, partial [Glycine soja]